MSESLRLPALPEPGAKRMAVRLTADALRHVRAGHPWIYDESIRSISHEGAPGDLAVIFDDDRKFTAIGLFDPASPIRIKVLHSGKPTTIDEEWWAATIAAAVERRSWLADDPDTTGWRLINGENDGMPGLVADRYAGTVTVKVYSAAWFPHLSVVLEAFLANVVGIDQIVVRLGRNVAEGECFGLRDGAVVFGAAGEPVEFTEHGLRFLAHPITGQKTGFFLDQRDNRHRVREVSSRARVLDVFSSTGGFSVAAAAGGATSVTSVDASPDAVRIAGEHMALNASGDSAMAGRVARCRWEGEVGDAFEVMARLRSERRRFDIVIVDPPSFAQRQASVASGLRAYGRLTEAALALVAPGGRLVQASCSSRIGADEFVDRVAATAAAVGRPLTDLVRTGHALDHPVTFPEGAYLKAVFARPGDLTRR